MCGTWYDNTIDGVAMRSVQCVVNMLVVVVWHRVVVMHGCDTRVVCVCGDVGHVVVR